jgi:biopolymer transport protein ExbD
MPFIDVFSLLNTFLLYSAVFLAVGIVEVQIPFLSNAAPPSKETRQFKINVEVMQDKKIEVVTTYSQPPANESKKIFDLTEAGLVELHTHMVSLRRDNPETDLVTFFTQDDVAFKDLTLVLDAVKLRNETDPVFPVKGADGTVQKPETGNDFLYPKVVMGSVMLKGGS